MNTCVSRVAVKARPRPFERHAHGWQSFTHQPYEWPQATSPTRAQPSP